MEDRGGHIARLNAERLFLTSKTGLIFESVAAPEKELTYLLGVRANTSVWWDKYQPAKAKTFKRGRPRMRLKRDARHQPISVSNLACALPPSAWRTVTWREGTKGKLSSRFARVRVMATHYNTVRDEEWLLIDHATLCIAAYGFLMLQRLR